MKIRNVVLMLAAFVALVGPAFADSCSAFENGYQQITQEKTLTDIRACLADLKSGHLRAWRILHPRPGDLSDGDEPLPSLLEPEVKVDDISAESITWALNKEKDSYAGNAGTPSGKANTPKREQASSSEPDRDNTGSAKSSAIETVKNGVANVFTLALGLLVALLIVRVAVFGLRKVRNAATAQVRVNSQNQDPSRNRNQPSA